MAKTTKEIYEKPAVTRHSPIVLGKHAGMTFDAMPFKEIDGFAVAGLLEKFGSPLYAISEKTLRDRYRTFRDAFVSRYPDTIIAYSYKTNYLSAVCAILTQEGAWAEVVSGFEYDIAEDLRIPGAQIVYNGPYKPAADLARAVENGSIINVDSFNELYQLEELARRYNKTVQIGIRINMQLNCPTWDKFGFNLESGQAFEACRRASNSGWLRVNGLHCHAGTYLADPTIYTNVIAGLIELGVKLEDEFDMEIEFFDVGGGYASPNTLHKHLMPGVTICPSYDQYAEAICGPLNRSLDRFVGKPRLILEPGRSIVDECMFLLTTVVATKRSSAGSKIAIVDAGVNLLPTAFYFKHDISPIHSAGMSVEEATICGPLCMQIDVLRQDMRLSPLQKGHVLVIKNTGAYNFS
ncbi:MAG TPA: alanine racemase, partial [Candidatus Avalokitesvara rifleensis]|uniref:alanine racemase n=1 Tax=Candidatus Avalokitesvara rifleensis TaxID=3367620 RepID=UPI0040281760